VLLFSLFLCVVGVLGLYGTCRGSKCVLAVFNLANLLMLLLALAIIALGFIAPEIIFKKECLAQDVDWFTALHRTYNESLGRLCGMDCECFIRDLSIYPAAAQARMQAPDFHYSGADPSLATAYQNCSRFEWNSTHESLQVIERTFNCTGWCSAKGYLLFSDINAYPGKDACFSAVRGYVEGHGLAVGVVGAVSSLLFVGNVVAGCYTCLTGRRPEDYDRLSEL
jgi:hypothetical protein